MRLRIHELILLTIILAGCGSPKEYLYTLSSSTASGSTRALPTNALASIVVGPVTLPEVVDRPQIVVRVGPNQVALAEQHRWAASLKREIPRVIAENLAQLLGSGLVSSYEQEVGARADIQVLLDVKRFDATVGEAATIESFWTIRRASGQPTTGRSVVREPIGGDGYDGLVAAHSRALAALSREIAEAIRSGNATGR